VRECGERILGLRSLRSFARNTGAGSGDRAREGMCTGTALGSLFDNSLSAWMRLVIPELTFLLSDATGLWRSIGDTLLEDLRECG
jgi:hypothetical protein